MKSKCLNVLILALFGIPNAFSFVEAELIETNLFTEKVAIELGMSPEEEINEDVIFSESDKRIDEHLENSRVVVLVNKGVRSNTNPDGQTAEVYKDGVFYTSYEVSTGTEKRKRTTSGRYYVASTPLGHFRPTRAYKEYASATFTGARMDYAVFFRGGIALHSTSASAYRNLGKRASGGCVRLRFDDAKEINEIIRSAGELHDKTLNQSFTHNGVYLPRKMYTDRLKLKPLKRISGELNKSLRNMWTYDASIIIIKE